MGKNRCAENYKLTNKRELFSSLKIWSDANNIIKYNLT